MSLPSTIKEVSELIKNKDSSPVELTKLFLERIDSTDKKLNSYITVLHDKALEDAKEAEKQILDGNYLGALHGVPISFPQKRGSSYRPTLSSIAPVIYPTGRRWR